MLHSILVVTATLHGGSMVKRAKSKGAAPNNTMPNVSQSAMRKPLPRGPHTLQLVFHTAVHSLLVLLCTIVLPAHLVSRQQLPEDAATASEVNFKPSDRGAAASPGLIASVHYYFALTANPHNHAILKRAIWGSLQALVVVQAWASLRFRKWYDLGAAIDSGDREAAQRVTKQGWKTGAERLALTTLLSLPAAIPLTYLVLILFGAPWPPTQWKETGMLALGITIVVELPLLNTLSSDINEWTRILGFTGLESADADTSADAPRERLLVYQAVVPLLAAFVFSAALGLDHGKAWLAWPLPPCLGLFLGAAVSQWVSTLHYLFAASR